MHASFTAINNLGWLEFWQVLKPQTCGLCLAMAELPWLDRLGWRPDSAANDADGVLDAPAVDRCGHKQPHKVQRLSLLAPFAVKMPAAGYRQMRAWRVGNHQIPAISKNLLYRLLQVPLRVAFTWQQIAAKSKMPATPKGITDAGTVFAGNQDTHQRLAA